MRLKDFGRRVGFKLTAAILLASIVLYAVSIAGAGILYMRSVRERYEKLSSSVAEVVSGAVDADSINSWLDGKNVLGYVRTSNRLLKISKGTLNLDSIIIYQMRSDGMHTVFNANSTGTRGDLGEVEPYDTQWAKFKEDFLAGKAVGDITVTGYRGDVSMHCVPLFASDGECVAYVCCGVAESTMRGELRAFIAKYGLALFAVLLLTFAVSVLYARMKIAKPLKKIGGAVRSAVDNGNQSVMSRISEMNIRTNDEVENIYRSIVKLYADKVQLSHIVQEEQKNVLLTFAAMIRQDSIDSVGYSDNTVEYVGVILNALRKTERYKDVITDAVYNKIMLAAPLHDIGKLVVSDDILYKPGKLTDKEYQFMKNRMQYGASIIKDLEDSLPEAEYLDLARQMAESHHERWDGKGYPYGLKGEEIPLPVRVISIADVFDALVAKRCYKEPLSVDAAYEVIMDGRGTNFDPYIVDVFVQCKEQITEIYNKYETEEGDCK